MTSDRIADLRPTAVNRVLEQVRRYQAGGKVAVSLMRGQPDSPTPRQIVEAAERALRAGRTGYADNRGEPAPAKGRRGQAAGANKGCRVTRTAKF